MHWLTQMFLMKPVEIQGKHVDEAGWSTRCLFNKFHWFPQHCRKSSFCLSASNSWTTAEKVVDTCVGCNSLVKADHTVARTRLSRASCTMPGQTSLMRPKWERRMKIEAAGRFMFENWSYFSNSMCDWTPHVDNPVKTHSSGNSLCIYKAARRAAMPGCRSTRLLDRWRSSPVKGRKLPTFLPAHHWLPGKS